MKILPYVIIAAVLTTASTISTQAHAGDTEQALSHFIEVLNQSMPPSSNPAAIAALFADDGVELHPFGDPPGGPFRGREALKKFFSGFEPRYQSWTHIESSHIVSGNSAVWEGVAQGVDRTSGIFLRLPIVFFFEFDDDGLVKEQRVYVDIHMVQQQVRQ